MGNFFLLGLGACFLVYELVMHFILKNQRGDQTLSNIIRSRKITRIAVVPILIILFLHLTLRLF